MGGNGPIVQPPTTRIGGGGSAHLVAIGVVVVLVALVWIGWSGRPTGRPAGGQALPSGGAAPTAVGARATPAGATLGPVGSVGPTPRRALPTAAPESVLPSNRLGDDVYAVTAGYAGAGSGTVLAEVDQGYLYAQLELPTSAADHDIFLELHQLSSLGLPNRFMHLRSFDLLQGDVVIDRPGDVGNFHVRVESEPNAQNASLLVRRGFDLTVRAIYGRKAVELVVDIELLAKTRRPADEDHRIFP